METMKAWQQKNTSPKRPKGKGVQEHGQAKRANELCGSKVVGELELV